MKIYLYNNITSHPDLDIINNDINSSNMSNKNVDYLRWDEDLALLTITWNSELSTEDKTILDNIVSENS